MSDPIKDLENFGNEGLPMNPISPSEVRRRGDRMRRRNNGVVALGAAAAVAVVAASGIFLTGTTDRGADQEPVAPSVTGTTQPASPDTIPADFPIDAGMSPEDVSDTAAMASLDYCGITPLADLAPADVRSAAVSGGETSVARTLYLFSSQDAAETARSAVLDAGAACATSTTAAGDGEVVVQPDDGSWPGRTITRDHGPGAETEPTVDVVHVVRAGPALLVTSMYGAWHDHLEAGIAYTRSDVLPVVNAMSVFGDLPSVDPVSESPGSGTRTPPISDDFPLGDGWPDDSEAESEEQGLEGPNRTLEALQFKACGETWAEPAYGDRLRANWTSAEDYRARQLTTYADADAAVAAVADLVAMLQACPEDPEREDGYVTHRTVRKIPFGGEGWAVLERDTFNGGDSPLGGSTMVIRVGHSVLVIRHDGHSGYPGTDNGQAQIDRQTGEAADVIAAMCAFTVAGCGDSDPGTDPASATTLGPDGWGELRIGMTAAEMEATGLVTIGPADDPAAACRAFTIKGWADTVHPNFSGQVHGMVSKLHGLAMIFAQPGMKTPEGIGVGSPVSDVRAAYGDLSGSGAYNTAPVDGRSYFFLTDGEKVTAYQLEHAEQDCMH